MFIPLPGLLPPRISVTTVSLEVTTVPPLLRSLPPHGRYYNYYNITSSVMSLAFSCPCSLCCRPQLREGVGGALGVVIIAA